MSSKALSHAQLEQRRAASARAAEIRRAAPPVTHCKYGHEFTPENTYYRRDGRRTCKTCKGDRQWYWRHGLRWKR